MPFVKAAKKPMPETGDSALASASAPSSATDFPSSMDVDGDDDPKFDQETPIETMTDIGFDADLRKYAKGDDFNDDEFLVPSPRDDAPPKPS